MDRNDQIAASAKRAAKLKVEATRREASAAMSKAAQRGVLRSSFHVQSIELVYVQGYRDACTAAAVQIAEIEGENAPQHAARLGEILQDVQTDLLGAFRKHASPGQSGDHMEKFVSIRRRHLQETLDEILAGTVADLDLGTAGGTNVRKQKSPVSIDNRGGSGQFVLNSPNTSQSVGRDQIVSRASIDAAAIKELLCQIRAEVGSAQVAVEARDEIEDAVVNLEREVASPTPDKNRTHRLLRALGTRLEQFGISIAASLVAAVCLR